MPNLLQALSPTNQNQLYLILNNAGYFQPNQANALGVDQYQGRPLMVVREDQMTRPGVNALNQYPGFAPGQLEETAANALDFGGNISTSMMPGMGDVRDAGEALGGRDWWTGQQLTGPERLMSAGAAAIPFIGAGMGRAIGQATAPFAEDLKRAIQTPEFKNWFRNSVVVDENGEPMAVYHFTNTDIPVFSRKKLGGNTASNQDDSPRGKKTIQMAKTGFWFTDHDISEDMVSPAGIPVFLNIQHPRRYGSVFDSLFNAVSRSKGANNFVKTLQAEGYDGLRVLDNEFGGTSYVVFSPNQIKSIWNRGTWDPNRPEISW